MLYTLKSSLILVPSIKKLTDKIQSLERSTNETKTNIHTQTEEFRTEPTTLNYETEEEQPKAIRKPISSYHTRTSTR